MIKIRCQYNTAKDNFVSNDAKFSKSITGCINTYYGRQG